MSQNEYGTTFGAGESKPALSVSGALALAKGALEGVTVRLVGEVSEVSNKPGYKAVYFSVKDASASLPCMMWNNRFQASGVALRVGMLVELTGRFTLYAAKGRMNFDVFSLSLAGEGNLRMQVANLAKKLQAEGLMAPERKRPLPLHPERIGVVTSPRGAAVHDVLRTLRRRFPLATVKLAGVPVEGAQAPAYLCEGLRCVVAAGVDVVLLVRGGGSFEDLMPFNDEGVARMVAACPVPVVTGIGHEPDTTIADMVADLRASTPTAAAESVVAHRDALADGLDQMASAMAMRMKGRLATERLRVERQMHRSAFGDPMRLFAQDAQMLDDLGARLESAIPAMLDADKRRLSAYGNRLGAALPLLLNIPAQKASSLEKRLGYQGGQMLQRFKRDVAFSAARLHDLSPLTVLARGYSITRSPEGTIVKSVDALAVGEGVRIDLADGSAVCTVTEITKVDSSIEFWEE